MINPQNFTLPRFNRDVLAWEWIAQELSKPPRTGMLPGEYSKGLCGVLMWMEEKGLISRTRRQGMKKRLYARFAPQRGRDEVWHGVYFWKMGVRAPRVVASQLMAILPVPRQEGR